MPISLRNTISILPWIRYSPQANTWTIAGEDNKPREVQILNKHIAVAIEDLQRGHLLIAEGQRAWSPFEGNNVPPSPGPGYKLGASVLLYAPKLLGSEVYEWCSSTNAFLSFAECLYNEAEPEFGKGNVPIVRIDEAKPIKIGKGKSRELLFKITKWVPCPAALGEAIKKIKTSNNGAASADADEDDDFAAAADDFADDADTAAAAEEESAKTEPVKEKPKGSGRKTKAKQPDSLSDILDDAIEF